MADYAIVVGVARYPGLAVRGVTADLSGPGNDARAMHDWLVDPAGGGLAPGNVKLLLSPEPLVAADPQPAMAQIERELAWLEERTRDEPGGRLYLYFSGHGFAPVLEEGALFTAEATHIRPAYVYSHAWLRWFRRAGRFRQFVLLMDCCMSYRVSIPVNEVLMGVEIATGVPGPAFVGLAAQTREALEYPMPDGTVHGVFTWALLAGLRGGAADERGRVTGASLKTFLHNAMPEFLPAEVRRAAAVDLQPFVRADDGIVFQRFAARPEHRVTVRAPGAPAGAPITIWTGRPHAPAVSEPLPADGWTGALVRGLYVAEVPAAGLRQGFAVSGAGDVSVELTQNGPPVAPPAGDQPFALEVEADNPAAAITVTDHRFEPAFTETGLLRERDLPGVYKVRVELGRDIGSVSEEIFLLDRDRTGRMAAPPPGARGDAPFALAVDGPDLPDGGAAIVVLAADTGGLELVDAAGARVAALSGERTVVEVVPGGYVLRQALPGGEVIESTVVASPGWVTVVALRRGADGAVDDQSVVMRPAGGGPLGPDQDGVVEAARLALAHGRDAFGGGRGARVRSLLLTRYLDPVAGIIGAHLVLRSGLPEAGASFDAAVRRLRGFVGWDHPDVEALSLRCTDPDLRTTGPVTVPPMFRAGWDLLVEASYDRPALVPAPVWARVHASSAIGPFFAWAADAATRDAHAHMLAGWAATVGRIEALAASGTDGTADRARAARRLGIPADAAAALWNASTSAEGSRIDG